MAEARKTHRVEWGETDAAGIVFYPNFYRWFDAATHDLFRTVGYSVALMQQQDYAIPLVETGARFLSSVVYDEEILIFSRVVEVRTRAFRVEHTVVRGDETVCEGYEVRIWVRLADGGMHPETIPQELRRLLAPG